MAGFVAQGVVEALDYDFRPFVNAHGTIKEPTDQQVAAWLEDIKKLTKEMEDKLPGGITGDDPGALIQALDDLDTESVMSVMGDMAGAYSKLCSGDPSAKQILNLPMRIRQVFFRWLQGEVMDPEVVSGAGTAQVKALPTAAAG